MEACEAIIAIGLQGDALEHAVTRSFMAHRRGAVIREAGHPDDKGTATDHSW